MNPLRHHHYLFAHRLIPTLFFQDTLQFVSLLQRDGLRFLEFWWRRVGEDVPQEERLSADGLGYTIREVAHGWVAVVIMMPLPQSMTEAYFVGLFFRPEGERKAVFFQPGLCHSRFLPATCRYGAFAGRI